MIKILLILLRICLPLYQKYFGPLVVIFLTPVIMYAQNSSLIVAEGANLVVGNGNLVLNNTDFHISGTLNASNGIVWITGINNTSLSGTGILQIQTMNLNTSAGSTFTLNNSFQISSALNFLNGVIDLNNNQIQLTGTAILQFESEASHITGLSGGAVMASATAINDPNQLDIGNLGAVLSSTANMGNLNISRSHKPAINPANSSLHSIQRTFLIEPQNNIALNATLRFYYFNEELNGDDPATLTLWKSSDGINWTQIGADFHNTVEKYVEKTGLADFSYWTLTDDVDPLPLTLVSFKAVCENTGVLLQWLTGVESDIDQFVIEKSTDATTWISIGKQPATNNPNGSTYSFDDPSQLANAYYRLKIIDISGKFSYSPVFKGGCADITLPFIVYPNPVFTFATAQVSVRESVSGNIQIFAIDGQKVYKSLWSLQPGINQMTLPVSGLSTGTYIVKLLLNNKTLQTKFIKE